MKLSFLLAALTVSSSSWGQVKVHNQLTEEDQKYFKNEVGTGATKIERFEANVREINKLHSEIAQLKSQMNALKAEVETIKTQIKK